MVSIVIPTLNEECNIAGLVEAIRRQDSRIGEIIVVDGGSNDHTVREASRFPGVQVIAGRPPVGAQRQLGLERASGETVVFLDADTYPSPDFVRRSLAESKRRRLDVACPWYTPYPSSPIITCIYTFFNLVFFAAARLLPSGAGSCIIANKEFAIRIGGFRSDLVYEDIEFIRRAGRLGHFGMLCVRLKVSDRRFREFGYVRMLVKYLLLSGFFTFGLFKLAGVVRYPFGRYGRTKEELVVLVDDQNNPVGEASKESVHYSDTLPHRGFSLFLLNRRGEVLLQQRSAFKRTWPGRWSNSCCGHPAPGESVLSAARRRSRQELGITPKKVRVILPDYRYRAQLDGIVENEICPVLVGISTDPPRINPNEVQRFKWMPWPEFVRSLDDLELTPWCVEEAALLHSNSEFKRVLRTVLSRSSWLSRFSPRCRGGSRYD